MNQESVRVMKIEGPCSVPMGLRLLGQGHTVASKLFGPPIDIFGTPDNEADVVDHLNLPRFGARGKSMEGKIVLPRCQVCIVFVGHPFQFQPQNLGIKFEGFLYVTNVQRDVAKPQKERFH